MISSLLLTAIKDISEEGFAIVRTTESEKSSLGVSKRVDVVFEDEYGTLFNMTIKVTRKDGAVIVLEDLDVSYPFSRESLYYCVYHQAAAALCRITGK